MDTSRPPRRWSQQSALLLAAALAVGILVLLSLAVRFAGSVGVALHAADAVSERVRIAPEPAPGGGSFVTPDRNAPSGAATPRPTNTTSPNVVPAATPSATASAAPSAAASVAAAAPQESVSSSGDDASDAVGGTSFGGAGGAGTAGVGGKGGAGGAEPTLWESVVQSTLALIGQTTAPMCGPNTCNTGQVCCNASCGTCVARGATCDQTTCAGAPRTPTVMLCGSAQCNDGQVCCNPSCGICAAPGEGCSHDVCR